jgi:hypothetical protein
VVVEVAGDDLLQPTSLLGNRLMNAPSQFLFDGLQLCLHAIPPGLPFDLEGLAEGRETALGWPNALPRLLPADCQHTSLD